MAFPIVANIRATVARFGWRSWAILGSTLAIVGSTLAIVAVVGTFIGPWIGVANFLHALTSGSPNPSMSVTIIATRNNGHEHEDRISSASFVFMNQGNRGVVINDYGFWSMTPQLKPETRAERSYCQSRVAEVAHDIQSPPYGFRPTIHRLPIVTGDSFTSVQSEPVSVPATDTAQRRLIPKFERADANGTPIRCPFFTYVAPNGRNRLTVCDAWPPTVPMVAYFGDQADNTIGECSSRDMD